MFYKQNADFFMVYENLPKKEYDKEKFDIFSLLYNLLTIFVKFRQFISHWYCYHLLFKSTMNQE